MKCHCVRDSIPPTCNREQAERWTFINMGLYGSKSFKGHISSESINTPDLLPQIHVLVHVHVYSRGGSLMENAVSKTDPHLGLEGTFLVYIGY